MNDFWNLFIFSILLLSFILIIITITKNSVLMIYNWLLFENSCIIIWRFKLAFQNVFFFCFLIARPIFLLFASKTVCTQPRPPLKVKEFVILLVNWNYWSCFFLFFCQSILNFYWRWRPTIMDGELGARR